MTTLKTLVRSLFVLAVLPLVACDEKSASEPETVSVVGTYELQTVNGAALPVMLGEGEERERWDSLTLILKEDNTIGGELHYVSAATGQADVDVVRGTFTSEGPAVTMSFEDGTTATGVLNGSTLTTSMYGMTWVYAQK